MDKAKRYTPFCNWVPKPLGAAVLLFLFVSLMFAGGTYLTNVAEMVGATGAWPEDYQLASSCAFIGMSVFFPFMVGYLQARSVKAVYVWGLALLVLINLVMPRAESVVVQCLLCLVLGFIRVMLVLNTTFTLAPYLFGVDTLALFTMKTLPDAPAQYAIDHQRSVLVVCLYVLLMSLIEWSNYVVAWVAYTYQWAYSYTLVNILLGAALLLVLLTMRHERGSISYKMPWKQIPDLLLTVVFLCAFCYVLIYGKTCDWYASPAIRAGTAIGLCAFGALLLKEASARTGTYLDLHVFAYRNVWIGMLLFLVTVIANYGSTLMVSYIKAASAADNLHGETLPLSCVLGCVLGGALSVVMIVRRIPYKYIFATGLLLVCISNVYLYFQYQPQGVYEHMILPSVCNFAGMFMPYAVVCAYGMNRLPSWLLPTWLFLMIAVRNAVAPAISMSVYGNLMQERQQHYVTRFVQDVLSLAGAVTVKGQAAIVAMKDVTGRIVWFTGIVAVLALAYPRRWSMRS